MKEIKNKATEEDFYTNLITATERLKNCKSFCLVVTTSDEKCFYNSSLNGATEGELFTLLRSLNTLVEECWLCIEKNQLKRKEEKI